MKKIFVLLMIMNTSAYATMVRFETTLGDVDIELYDDEAPSHVANFLNYVEGGDYDDTVIHRSVYDFVLQGGGFQFTGGRLVEIPSDPALNAEVGISNLRGTLALAKVGNRPSGSNQWFINMKDNQFLDTANGGFSVFGKVTEGMEVVDLINSLRITSSELPLFGYGTGAIVADNLIFVKKAYVLVEPEFKVNAGISGAWYNPATSGQGFYFEMLPQANALLAAWFTYDLFQPEDTVMSAVGHPGHRWLTSQGTFVGNTFSQTIALTRNGLFDSADSVETVAAGTLTIEFTSCFEAVVSYVLDDSDLSGSFSITRLSGDNVAMCEQLSAAAQ
mgnify:CR=1 FL=1